MLRVFLSVLNMVLCKDYNSLPRPQDRWTWFLPASRTCLNPSGLWEKTNNLIHGNLIVYVKTLDNSVNILDWRV